MPSISDLMSQVDIFYSFTIRSDSIVVAPLSSCTDENLIPTAPCIILCLKRPSHNKQAILLFSFKKTMRSCYFEIQEFYDLLGGHMLFICTSKVVFLQHKAVVCWENSSMHIAVSSISTNTKLSTRVASYIKY